MNVQSADQLAYNIKAEILRLSTEKGKMTELQANCIERGAAISVHASFVEAIASLDRQLVYLERLCQGVDLYS